MQTNPSSSLEINQLEKVFATFNQVSADLGSRYQQLEIQVAGLSDELAASHSARIQELTEKELLAAKLTALMSALPGGIITLDADSIIKEENAIAIELLGHSLKSSHWSEVFENTSPNTPTLHGEISVKSTNKRISISSSPYGDDDLKDTNTIILLTDITENYRLNNQLIREERLAELGEMAAKLAHQIRTPLSSAILYLSHL
ncbi:PAS domain-containing sensor histidine kinase, partial [Gammaproteobacteria bacterium AH-315-E17]|nr:PAS domain-containing sensor histidine kinase [Gammaproteobacteria bacterium AH-315-E17]